MTSSLRSKAFLLRLALAFAKQGAIAARYSVRLIAFSLTIRSDVGASCILRKRKKIANIALSLLLHITLRSLNTSFGDCAQAQIVPDRTLGAESSAVTPVNPHVDLINAGAIRGTNLFHSFSDFNVNEGRAAYFANPAGIENILSRVTGTNPSHILGKLGVLGNANLFFLNPNGVIFGPNATLDLRGSFVTSTANSFIFADGTLFSATNPETPPLLTINVPIGVQFGTSQPGAIINAGSLAVEPRQNFAFIGGTVVSTGQLVAPDGQLVVMAMPDSSALPDRSTLTNSSLPQLLSSWEGREGSGLTLNSNGEVELVGSGLRVDTGDVVVQQLTAGMATVSAAGNLTLMESQLQTTGNLNLLAQDTVRVRDSVVKPFLAQAGGSLYIQGNSSIDILALNHPQTPFQSGGHLSLVSDGTISGDAHFSSGGNVSILNVSGGPGNFVSFYDPIFSALGDVIIPGAYTGASLKIEATGNIVVGNITITAPDTMLVGSDPDIPILTGSAALILRAGVTKLENPPSVGVSYTIANLGTLPGANSSSAAGINDAGQVVGISGARAFLWNSGTGMQNLGPRGGNVSRALGVNNTGQVVGESDGRAFLWDSSNGMQDLGDLGGNFSAALAINNAGQVVGTSTTGNGDEARAFLWDSNTGMQNLGTLPNFPSDSIARGINDGGQVVGESGNCSVGCRPFLWDSDTGMQNLGTLGGNVNNRAFGVNNAGQVVGESNSRAFLWDSDTGMQNLGTLPGDNFSRAWDINNESQVVGQSGTRTFLWQNGVMSDLNSLILTGSGWSNLSDARAINDVGQIVGTGEIDGQSHAFLMTPIKVSPPGAGSIAIADVNTAGGPIILSAASDIKATGIINSNGGDISFDSGGVINMVAATLNSSSPGRVGDITIEGQSVFLAGQTGVFASTLGSAPGGNVTVTASETVELSGGSRLLTETGGFGDAGSIQVNTNQLIVRDGSAISASVGEDSTGEGGNLTVSAESVKLIGIAPNGSLPSRLATGTAGSQKAGDLSVNTNRLVVRDGAALSTGTSSNAQGGNLTVNANSVELIGTSAESTWLSVLSADTGGAGNAGDLTINTEQLIVRDGAAVSSSTVAHGQGGNLTVNASDFVELSGTANNGFASGLYAQAFADRDAGNLTIETGELRIIDGAKVTVAAGSVADARVPVNQLPGIGVNIPPGQARGDAGNLEANADLIFLDNQGKIIASTDSGEGGNINLEARDLLLMRYNSLISAEARGTGNGGNVTIDAHFLVGVRSENSDIIANAFQGNGGRVQITTQGIYGLQYRPRLTPLSDITASSTFGVDGVVEINTPDIDPSRGLAELPAEPVNSQLDQRCQDSGSQATSRFINTGRGGLPLDPDEISSNTVWEDLRRPADANNSWDSANVTLPENSRSGAIVEAQGWVKLSNNTVVLTAQVPTATPYSSSLSPATCYVR